jgi:DNA-binding transcriptional LysR family regulator
MSFMRFGYGTEGIYMEWQQLEYFQTVAREQHFTRAAKKLAISQPALSRSIARLEDELGVPLFERSGRSIRLNRYGEMFLEQVDAALGLINEGVQKLRDMVDPERGTVSLAFLHTLGTHLVPDLLGSFRKKHPHIQFQLFQDASSDLFERLKAGELDLCLSSGPVKMSGVVWEELFRDELYVIVPEHHPLADRDEINLWEIADEPFISLKKGYGLRALTDRLCRQAGFTPNITFEGEEVTTVAGLVSAGLGVALIPETGGEDMRQIRRLHVRSPHCQRVIGIAWVEGRYLSPAAKLFRQFVLDHFR